MKNTYFWHFHSTIFYLNNKYRSIRMLTPFPCNITLWMSGKHLPGCSLALRLRESLFCNPFVKVCHDLIKNDTILVPLLRSLKQHSIPKTHNKARHINSKFLILKVFRFQTYYTTLEYICHYCSTKKFRRYYNA